MAQLLPSLGWGMMNSALPNTYLVLGTFCRRRPWMAWTLGMVTILSVFMMSRRIRAMRLLALSLMNRYLPSYLPSVIDRCGWWQSPLVNLALSPMIRLLSLVMPQPVAESWLNTGMRISPRMDGMPSTRTSPSWPPDMKRSSVSSWPGPTWILSIAFFWSSLTAWGQASRLITAPPKAVAATAAPVAALAPRKPRRLRPLASGLAGGLLIL